MEGCIAEIHNITSLDISDNGKYTDQEQRVVHVKKCFFFQLKDGRSCFMIMGHVGYENVSDQDLLLRNVERLNCTLKSLLFQINATQQNKKMAPSSY